MSIAREIVTAIDATDGTVPEVRNVRRRYSAQLRDLSGAAMFQLALTLVRERSDLVRFVAYELIHFHSEASASLRKQDVVALGEGMRSWGAVDSFAYFIAGPAWKRGQIEDAVVASWTDSKSRWWRRAALVSTVILNRKPAAKNNVERTLSICVSLIEDRDDMVVKALSWALRELSKADADAARRFVRENDRALSSRVKREVANKLNTGLKVPKLKNPDASSR